MDGWMDGQTDRHNRQSCMNKCMQGALERWREPEARLPRLRPQLLSAHAFPLSSFPTYSRNLTVSLSLLEGPVHLAVCASIMRQGHMEGPWLEWHSRALSPLSLTPLMWAERHLESSVKGAPERGWLSSHLSLSATCPWVPVLRSAPTQEGTHPEERPGAAQQR